jgi:hypothetical protein
VSPQPARNRPDLPQPKQQQQQQEQEDSQAVEEERDACSFMWFDMTPQPKKTPTEVVRRQKKVVDSSTKKSSTNRHSAPPGSLDFHLVDVSKSLTNVSSIQRRTSQKIDVQKKPTELKRRKSTTTLYNPERRKESQSRFRFLMFDFVDV